MRLPQAFATALAKNSKLQRLDLDKSRLGDAGLQAWPRAVLWRGFLGRSGSSCWLLGCKRLRLFVGLDGSGVRCCQAKHACHQACRRNTRLAEAWPLLSCLGRSSRLTDVN